MKNKKWVDVRIGENAFTVCCKRSDESDFGTTICFKIYELHEHPTNFFERIFESWKYQEINRGYWIEGLSTSSIQDKIIKACANIVSINDKHSEIEKEWKNL